MNDLRHFGVLGMRWGVRRKRGRPSGSSDHVKASKLKKKKLSEMSNDELSTLNKRLELEKKYKDLTSKDISGGKKAALNILGRLGNSLLNKAIEEASKQAIKQVLKVAGLEEIKDKVEEVKDK